MGLPQASAEPEASGDANRGASPAAIPGEIFRFQRAALSREAAGSARHRAELQLGEDRAANGRPGEASQAAGLTPQAPAAPGVAGHDAAHRWQRSRLVSRWAASRTDCDSG